MARRMANRHFRACEMQRAAKWRHIEADAVELMGQALDELGDAVRAEMGIGDEPEGALCGD